MLEIAQTIHMLTAAAKALEGTTHGEAAQKLLLEKVKELVPKVKS